MNYLADLVVRGTAKAPGMLLLELATPVFESLSQDYAVLCDGLRIHQSHAEYQQLAKENPYLYRDFSKSPLPELFLAVVDFDDKLGSVVEYVYPEYCLAFLKKPLHAAFVQQLCFAAIPDAAHTLEAFQLFVTDSATSLSSFCRPKIRSGSASPAIVNSAPPSSPPFAPPSL